MRPARFLQANGTPDIRLSMDTLYDDLPAPKSSNTKPETKRRTTGPSAGLVPTTIRHVAPPAVLRKRPRASAVPPQKPHTLRKPDLVFDQGESNDDGKRSDREAGGYKNKLNDSFWAPPGVVDEEYDPLKPNDYAQMKACLLKEERGNDIGGDDTREEWETCGEEWERMETESRRSGAYLLDDAVQEEDMESEEEGVGGSRLQTGEDAYLRRGHLSKKKERRNGKAAARKRSQNNGEGGKSKSTFTNEAVKKMMEKMGWREGQGLGSKCEGRIEPVDGLANHAEGRRGLGGGRGPSRGLGSESDLLARDRKPQVSRILVLRNMAGVDDVDEALENETRAECAKFGMVERVVVHVAEKGRTSGEHAVQIFVAFQNSESAGKALLALNGRFFGGRTVRASFFPEHRFEQRNLFVKTHEGDR